MQLRLQITQPALVLTDDLAQFVRKTRSDLHYYAVRRMHRYKTWQDHVAVGCFQAYVKKDVRWEPSDADKSCCWLCPTFI